MYWELGFLKVFLCTIVSPYFIVKSLQLRERRQIAEPQYCLVRVIVLFGVCFLYLFCFSQIGILVKFPTIQTLSLSLTCAVSFPLSLYASMEAEGVDDYSGDCFLNRCASICAVAGDDRSYLLGSLFFGFTL